MDFPWSFFIDLGIISIALLAATLLRAKRPFFQRYLIPNALTAGFFLLFFYNFLAPRLGLSADGLGALVYHLLSLSFIAMSLRKAPAMRNKGDHGIISTSVAIISQYAIQAFFGLMLTFLFIKTILPRLFPAFGFFLPLGYALGPGQAFAIGKGWESFGFTGAGSIGLTFAAVGFLWACFGGILLINYGIRKGWASPEKLAILRHKDIKTGVYPRQETLPSGAKLTTESEAIDSITYNAAMVLAVYIGSYLLLKLLTWLLSFAGKPGHDLAVNLWGISFVFAALVALFVRKILNIVRVDHTLDNGTLTRISGISVDLMVAASLGAISLIVVFEYWLPILITCLLGGFLVLVTVPWFCSRIFKDHQFDRTLIIYGACTGTMPTGLALLRVIDPDFETPVASDYMFSSAVTFVLVIPFILAINLPVYSYTTGNPLYFWLAIGVALAYLAFSIVMFFILGKKRAFLRSSKVWLKTKD